MTTGLQIIQAHDIPTMFPSAPDSLEPYILRSNPIFAGIYHDDPFCLIGIVPQHISGQAAVWGWNTPLVAQHPYIYGRWAHRLIRRVHTLYPVIIGACPAQKLHWIISLGATVAPGHSDPMFNFRIEARS